MFQEDNGFAADATNEKVFPDGMADVEVGKKLAEVWLIFSCEFTYRSLISIMFGHKK